MTQLKQGHIDIEAIERHAHRLRAEMLRHIAQKSAAWVRARFAGHGRRHPA